MQTLVPTFRELSREEIHTLLDRRVLEKNYGRYFLESLPPAPLVRGAWEELRERIEPFYARSLERRPTTKARRAGG